MTDVKSLTGDVEMEPWNDPQSDILTRVPGQNIS